MMSTDAELLSEFLCDENQHEIVTIARGLCPFAEAVPDDVILVCVGLVEAKGSAALVAEALGFSVWQIKRRTQSQVAQRIIKKITKEKMSGEGYLKAVSALMDVASSTSSPAAARNSASKTLIELADAEEAGKGGDLSGGVDLNAMTLAQLEAYCNSIKQDLMRVPPEVALIEGKPPVGG